MRNGFILRFDDLCPTINWENWAAVETILLEFGVKPIISVIPDNRDKKLFHGNAGADFWERVRCWQSRDWTIGLHGYQHCYWTKNAGKYGRTGQSEFAGLPYEVQEIKLRNAIRILSQNGVRPEVWVAPGHSFDSSTIDILAKLGIPIINDGYALYPYADEQGLVWIPQQLGKFRHMPIGIWTVCLHFNEWTDKDLNQFRHDVEKFRPDILAVSDILEFCNKPQTWIHAGASRLLDVSLRVYRPLREGLKQHHEFLRRSANAHRGWPAKRKP